MRRAALTLVAILPLAGCSTIPTIVGVLSGAAAGGGTASPAVGFAVGIATATATGVAVKYYGKSRQHAEQDAIARIAGALPIGGRAPWRIRHYVPIGDEDGEISVLGDIVNPLAPCRSVAFSVADGVRQRWYRADICRRASGWQWASAEPAVPRWGYLQ
ncbi:MAG: hypothetical protein ABI369_11945 [Acetobacteraceae bacterium]